MDKTKTNKKSKSLIVLLLAILLCIAVVLGMGGFTYAKYISSKSVETQTAQVAKWGWQLSVDSSKLFGDAYGYDSTTQKNDVVIDYPSTDSVSVGVKASTQNNLLVAPGTEGYVTFSISGSAEVRSAITIATSTDMVSTATDDKTVTTVTLTPANGTAYEPIKWTLGKGAASGSETGAIYYTVTGSGDSATYTIVESSTTGAKSSLTGMTYADLIGVLNALDDSSTSINPGDEAKDYYKLSWAWAFEAEDNASPDKDTVNLYDTILGAIMAYSDATDANNTFTGPDNETIVVTNGTTAEVTDKSGTKTTYTATTEVKFGLTISVAQIQGTAS